MKEQDIIQGCVDGNQLAYKAFVEQYSAYLYSICYRYMGNAEYAKDATQECLVQVITKIHKYQDRGKFKAWISSVSVKKCLDLLRKEKRHKYTAYEDSPEPYVNEQVSLNLEKEEVMGFINNIPDRYRIAINMYLIEGYSHKEIAEQLNISESSSRSLVSRGRKMVIDAFGESQLKMNTKVSKIKEEKKKIGKLKII